MRSRLWWLGVLCLVVALGLLLLQHFRTDGVLATLDGAQGTVERDFAIALGRFSSAAIGSRFRVGDAVKTAHGSSARLLLDDASQVALREDTLLRFLATPPEAGGMGIDVLTGAATLETGDAPLSLYTSVGLARLEAKTSIVLEPRPSGLRFSVQVGQARFETPDGIRVVEPGGAISIDIGGAVIEEPHRDEPVVLDLAARDFGEPHPGGMLAALVEGKGVELRDPETEVWRPLGVGKSDVAPGASLRLPPATRVTLSSDAGSVTLSGRGEFTVGAPGGPFVQSTSGRIAVERARQPLSLAVPGGSITVRPWAKAEAAVDARRTTLVIGGGSAEVAGAFGRDEVLAGESATLLRSGQLELTGRGPQNADMFAVAGTSFVVHDPSPPTAVGFSLQSVCPGGGLVELLAGSGSRVLARSRGQSAANLSLGQGTHRYQTRCIGDSGVAPEASASGVVTILRDTGTGLLARVAPVTRIDTDGRSYTVMYQNLLPQIVVRWPKAPPAASYTLTRVSKSGTSSLASEHPTLTFKAGQVGEGSHTLTFGADGRNSPPTKLAIVFDNAAPTARIQSPENGSFQLGSAVNVAGVAIPGWGISVAGHELAVDDQSRFSEPVTTTRDQQTLQLAFTHPRRGIHYYLRHAAGAPP